MPANDLPYQLLAEPLSQWAVRNKQAVKGMFHAKFRSRPRILFRLRFQSHTVHRYHFSYRQWVGSLAVSKSFRTDCLNLQLVPRVQFFRPGAQRMDNTA